LEEKMRKILITLTVAITMVTPALTGRLYAGETQNGGPWVKQKPVSQGPAPDENAIKAAEVRKTEEAKRAERARRSAGEARKIIVARVNGADINMFMLVRAMNRVAPRHLKKGETATPEISGKIRNEALDWLIFEELAVQEAVKQGIKPAPEDIRKVIDQVKQDSGTEQAYREYLEKSFLTEEKLKDLIERGRRYELITAREIYEKAEVDEKFLRAEYEKEKGKFVLPDNFAAEDVFFLQGKDEEAVQKKADEVLKSIRKNNDDVWKLVQDGTFIVKKTNITKERHPELYKAVTGMKAGDLSGIIKDKDGLHIIKVIKKEPSRQLTFEEAKSAIEPKFLVPAQEKRKQEWEKQLRKNAIIEIMKTEN
jgi:peptidyl-prolyl cis-trans isomerase C